MIMGSKTAGDGFHLDRLPVPPATKEKHGIKRNAIALEIESNKSKLAEIKKQMKDTKDLITKYKSILQKEVGSETDVKQLLIWGATTGQQSRTQEIMNLRLQLTAMRSKFLNPAHKMYYIGPFDPKREFDIKLLPEKQNNLYEKLLEDKKRHLQQNKKPVEIMKKELDQLSLKYRASKQRTKSLKIKVSFCRKKIDELEERTSHNLKIVDILLQHQNLFKMMIDSDTFQLDPDLTKHKIENPLEPKEISAFAKNKTLYLDAEKEIGVFENVMIQLAEKLDNINYSVLETHRIASDVRMRLQSQKPLDAVSKGKSKNSKSKDELPESDGTMEIAILLEENQLIRDNVLLGSILSNKTNFSLVIAGLAALKQEFLFSLSEIQ